MEFMIQGYNGNRKGVMAYDKEKSVADPLDFRTGRCFAAGTGMGFCEGILVPQGGADRSFGKYVGRTQYKISGQSHPCTVQGLRYEPEQ